MKSKVSKPHLLLSLAWLVAVIFAIAYCINWFSQNTVETDIFALIPGEKIPEDYLAASESLVKRQENKVVVLMSSKSRERLLAAVSKVKGTIIEIGEDSPSTIVNYSGVESQSSERFFRKLSEFRTFLISREVGVELHARDDSYLSEVLADNFYNSLTFGATQRFANDPFGFYEKFIIGNGFSQLPIEDDFFLLNDSSQVTAVLFFEVEGSVFDEDVQARYFAVEDELRSMLSDDIVFESVGVIHHAARSREIAKNEITLISSISTLGILLLFLLVFRRITPLLFALMSLSVGILIAVSLSILIFNGVHILTLIFGASLIGISIDYAFHFFSHYFNSNQSGLESYNKIRAAITLGFVTSTFGFLSLVLTDFPALVQLAVFAVGGLFGAFATVSLWLSVLPRRKSAQERIRITHPLVNLFSGSRRYFYLSITVALGLMAALFGSTIDADDDIRLLRIEFPDLEKSQSRVAELFDRDSGSGFFLVKGNSLNKLLVNEEELVEKLDELKRQGNISHYSAVSTWLPSAETFANNRLLLNEVLVQSGLGKKLLDALGLKKEIVDGYIASIANESLVLDYSSTLHELVQFHPNAAQVIRLDNGSWVSQVSVSKISNTELATLEQLDNVIWYDKVSSINSLFSEFRLLAIEYLLIAYSLVLLVFVWRYGFQKAIATILPSVIAICSVILFLSFVGVAINLFHILATIIVLAVGIDFSLFINESNNELEPAILASTLSAITTVLAFGMLSFSETLALASFGQVIGIGILLVYLLAPLSVSLTKQHQG